MSARGRLSAIRSHAIDRRVPGPTIHHRMPEPLTYSFKHLFELTRELSISSDQVADHSRNDHAAVTLKADPSTWRGRR